MTFEHEAERVLEGDAEEDDAAPVVIVKVNPLCDFAASHRKEHRTAPAVARLKTTPSHARRRPTHTQHIAHST